MSQAKQNNALKRSILITGCSSGIGHWSAHHLNNHGYQVLATCRKVEDVEKLKREGLNAFVLDLQNTASIEAGFEWALSQTGGKLDALFNNGAYAIPGAVEDLPTNALRELFEANFFGWHHLTRLAVAVMRHQDYGRIIQNSSVLGFAAMPYRGAYNASKYAIEGLTDTMRQELRDTPIKVSLIEPGPIVTRFRQNAFAAFENHIDQKNSAHAAVYEKMSQKLQQQGPVAPGTLPPHAVTKKLLHALESSSPQPRYYVTWPTYLFGALKRVMSTRLLDWASNKVL